MGCHNINLVSPSHLVTQVIVAAATYVNLMDQYRPCYRADGYPPLERFLSREEYAEARCAGLHRFDQPRR